MTDARQAAGCLSLERKIKKGVILYPLIINVRHLLKQAYFIGYFFTPFGFLDAGAAAGAGFFLDAACNF